MPVKSLKIELLPVLKKIPFVKKSILATGTIGEYKSVFKGKGLEFVDYRNYTESDDASLIDWKASARAGDILVREYIEERNLNIVFVLDVSNSMLFGSTEKLKVEYAAELIASLAHAMLEAGDNVGLVLFTDKITAKLLPNRGKQQYYSITRILLNPEYYGGKIDVIEVSKFLLTTLKEGTIIILVSDFINFEGGWEKYLEFMSAKFEVIGFMIRDPRDSILPEDVGQVVIEDPYSNKQLLIEPELVKKSYEVVIKKQITDIKEKFTKLRDDMLVLETDKPFIKPIVSFFRRRGYKRG